MKISNKTRELIGNEAIKMRISLDLGVSYGTFCRWIRTMHKNLTTLETIKSIAKHTGLKESEIFEKQFR